MSLLVVALAASQPLAAEQRVDAVQAFAQRAEGYVALHRQLERGVAPSASLTDPASMLAASDALRASLARARAGAREGQVFDTAAPELRQRIRRTLREHGIEARDLIAEMEADTEGAPPALAVNARFSWLHGNVMLACVLQALPPLPAELEYRFVGSHLVILDIHADMVVDILRDVLPAAGTSR
jgi:hypothetical protein